MTINISKQTGHQKAQHHYSMDENDNVPVSQIEEVPRAMVVRQLTHKAGDYIPFHSHGWGQLFFISEGLIQVSARDIGYWVVPPQRAIWIPAFIEHDARTIHSVEMHNVYIAPDFTKTLPEHCQVVHITPLLRELILAMSRFDTLYEETGSEGRLVQVFLDQLVVTPEQPLHLPHPSSANLKKITDSLLANPANQDSMEDWAARLSTSSRSLARHFRQETGMTFGQWRQQARLLASLTRIARGDPIAHIAQDLGYGSQSAFISMFRKALGKTPGRYFLDE